MDIWRGAGSIVGTPAEAYLARRGLYYEGEALRWQPACPFGKNERHGCMLALVRNIVTNEPQAIHRTAIDEAGRKLSHLGANGRLAYGPTAAGAVKLTEDADISIVLALGEGIETALSIRHLSGCCNMPVWSVLSASGIERFPVLAGIETVWIATDNDLSATGQRATKAAAERMAEAGVETVLVKPLHVNTDLNDWAMKCHA